MAEAKTAIILTRRSHKKAKKPPSWLALNIFSSCKHRHQVVELHKKKKSNNNNNKVMGLKSSSVIKEAAEPSSGAVSASSSFNSSASVTATFSSLSSSSSSLGGSFREMHPSLMPTLSPCTVCGDIFLKPESLELHQADRHAVIELGHEDPARSIVKIIFMSSWMKKNQQAPVCKIDRVLKVQNLHRTVSMFEGYRESIKAEASKQAKKHPRCMADGNELLRFHCTNFLCSLGPDGAAELCRSTMPRCGVCSIIRNGFKADEQGKISTAASSRRAHGAARVQSDGRKRAVLVCRVIAGRVKKGHDSREECDSVICSDRDELCVFDPRAILPCFVVVYSGCRA